MMAIVSKHQHEARSLFEVSKAGAAKVAAKVLQQTTVFTAK
jgi:hypothetical protein